MINNFELEKENYYSELITYLKEYNITISEYINTIEHDSFFDVTNPSDIKMLNTMKEAFDLFKYINNVLVSFKYEKGSNLAYLIMNTFLDGLHDKTQYALLEDSIVLLVTDKNNLGRLFFDLKTFVDNENIHEIFFEKIAEENDIEDLPTITSKIRKNLEILQKRINKKLENTPILIKLEIEHIFSKNGVEKYIEVSKMISNYIKNEGFHEKNVKKLK